jgi:hypothetical protein
MSLRLHETRNEPSIAEHRLVFSREPADPHVTTSTIREKSTTL